MNEISPYKDYLENLLTIETIIFYICPIELNGNKKWQ